jgi:S1-C subfamily serine protease
MPLKKHHKIIIGSFSSLVIIFMITGSVFVYTLFLKQNIDYSNLNNKIFMLEESTQGKINILTESLIETQELAEKSQEALQLEMNLLKASAGEDFSGIIEDSIKSVVIITTDSAKGSGFLISDDGYIVTNYHVIKNGVYVQAITYEQKTIPASVIGYSQNLDMALLKISGTYDSLKLEDSNDIQLGEKVIAIGNPYGLEFSVTAGIISAIQRAGINGIKAYIQIDAPLNPGNSGGPLINKNGKVIGINNFKVGEAESLGFALESNYMKDVVNEISQEVLQKDLL